MKYLNRFSLFEGVTEKAFKRRDKNLDVSEDKKEQMRKKVSDYVKSFGCKTNQIGNDLEIHLDNKHIAQVMFRKDYIGVHKIGNKFPKELGYNEFGKIKSELSDIIKSNEEINPLHMDDEERDEYERGRLIKKDVELSDNEIFTLQDIKDSVKMAFRWGKGLEYGETPEKFDKEEEKVFNEILNELRLRRND